MVETTIQFKPRSEWRAGMTTEKLIDELDRTVRLPGLANLWIPPIRNRLDMLATGIKSPVGVKVSGADLAEIDRIAAVTERGAQVFLGAIADIRIADGPPMLKSENARPAGWIYVDLPGRDLRSAV